MIGAASKTYRASTMKMLADNLLVRPLAESESIGGIIIPDVAKAKRSDRGVVLALGAGAVIEEMGLRVGDVVVVEDFVGSGMPIDIEGEGKCLIFGADEVQAVLSP